MFPSRTSFTVFGRAAFRTGRSLWIVSKVLEEVSPEEMQKRMDAIMGGMQEKGSAEAGKPGNRSPQSKTAKSKTK